MGRTIRLALVGWGAIARTVARLVDPDLVEIIAVAVRDPTRERPDLPATARLLTEPEELAATEPELVAEAAGRDSVAPWARAGLEAGADVLVSSGSAFADGELLASLRAVATQNRAQLQIHPGALAGVDALAAARTLGIDAVEHRIVKPPTAWLGTPAEQLCDLGSLASPEVFFRGSAAEAASRFPKNANVAMTSALAGIGPDATVIALVADPESSNNRHEIAAHGAFGRLEVSVANNPLPDNPKTSALAALSLVRAIENRAVPIVI